MGWTSDKPDEANSGTNGFGRSESLGRNGLAHGDGKDSSRTREFYGSLGAEKIKGARGPYKKSKGADGGSYGYLYGNLYEQAQARRQKVLGFLQKDLFQIGKPDFRGFMNANHAYECLLPYHVFGSGVYEDMLFANSREMEVIPSEIDEVVSLMKEAAVLESRSLATEETLVCELLLYYQQRYINSIYGDERKQKGQRRYRQQLNKRNTVFRLKIGVRTPKGNDVDVRNGRLYFKKVKGD
ncbi:hypothetical protein M970_081010 [Encephalitozoon cuniculi EcunIII-L]|nr:hypothetical protein M970_081010 [Encephalitozoon cuniculi EcunIII-L]UYI27028.1 hypothetical protein J0A71_04g08780 [Encephalitozoon cuniculi]